MLPHMTTQHIVMPPSAVVAAAAKEDAATTDKTAFDLQAIYLKHAHKIATWSFRPIASSRLFR
jgi:hypothetical protein